MTLSRLPTRCKHCKVKFTAEERGKRLHNHCIEPWTAAFQEKQKRKAVAERKAKDRVEKAVDRKVREMLKPRAKWLAECQVIVNRITRLTALRRGEGCYTCGATPEQKFGGTYDAGHFRSVGSAPHLRFWMPQIKLQCIVCNRHKGGMALSFRQHLVKDHGNEWVERLEAMHHVAKFDIDYLKRFKAVMGRKLRRLEKRMA